MQHLKINSTHIKTLCFQAPQAKQIPERQPPKRGKRHMRGGSYRKPPLGLLTRLKCLFLLGLGSVLQRITLRLLHKKYLPANYCRHLLAWRAELNEAAIRLLRR
ncbi:hypothetical protein [Pseudochrobactrum sp. MP213Fo]|uniref:hypothetical protein n=1 Tax=Pseudochrobactrum sp. MP213Fo TaxID=3022250 RepID=UPI003B9DDFDD